MACLSNELTLVKYPHMNWPIITGAGILVIALILFLVRQNNKDKKKLEENIKKDYPHPRNEEGDVEIDEVMK